MSSTLLHNTDRVTGLPCVVDRADHHGVGLGDAGAARRRLTTCAATRPTRRPASRRRDRDCRPSPPIRTPPASAPGARSSVRTRHRDNATPSRWRPCYRPVAYGRTGGCENLAMTAVPDDFVRWPGRRRGLHHRDRRTGQGRRRAALPRRRHRGSGRPSSVTFGDVWALLVDGRFGHGLPPAEPFPLPIHSGDVRVDVQAGLADARADLGLPAAARHRRRHRPRPTRPRLGDGAVLRRTVRPRHLPARRPAADDRRMLTPSQRVS